MVSILNCNSSIPLDYITANQISLNKDGNFEIVGTSERSSERKYIKSPYVSIFSSDLEYISRHTYKTNATTINPRLITKENGSKILSYYKPESLDIPTEKSYVVELDQQYNFKREINFGKRHRVDEVLNIGNQQIISVYNREKSYVELRAMGASEFITPFTLNSEPCIPTDLEKNRNNNFLVCGIQNGFHYPDGFDYNESAAFGFLVEFDQRGKIINQKEYNHDQHVFYNDIEVTKGSIILTGTKQQAGSSMDLMIVSYDDSLRIKNEKTFKKEGYQYGVKTKLHDSYYYTLITTENPHTNKDNFSLMKSDSLLQTVWIEDFQTDHSVKPIDFIIANQKIYCITNTKSSDVSSVHAEIYMISLEGDLIKKQPIQ